MLSEGAVPLRKRYDSPEVVEQALLSVLCALRVMHLHRGIDQKHVKGPGVSTYLWVGQDLLLCFFV